METQEHIMMPKDSLLLKCCIHFQAPGDETGHRLERQIILADCQVGRVLKTSLTRVRPFLFPPLTQYNMHSPRSKDATGINSVEKIRLEPRLERTGPGIYATLHSGC